MPRKPTTTPIEPTERHNVLGDKYQHPSFGSVVANRYMNGSGRGPMFGSKVLHNAGGIVYLEIRKADYYRSLHDDHIMPREVIVKVEMTEAQWAHMISSFGVGGGTPCTIREVMLAGGGFEQVEETPFFEMVEQFEVELHSKLEEDGRRFREMADQFEALAESGASIPKGKFRELVKELRLYGSHLPNNLKFFGDQFERSMSKTVDAAKLEIESHIERVVRATGLEALRDKMPALASPKDHVQAEIGPAEDGDDDRE